ncbi:MAG: choice-of-anchor L domain-containing protein [Saprospiraceae bacterium]|nr:choice-of-anchor L domain-containing protein [Saprospiraceae bacterium]MDW8484449.1 choice-of-anchor L domain-containing protein [Saprospiraceae bacterium]
MNVFSGKTTVEVCGFESGRTYQVIANAAFYGQEANFELRVITPEAMVQPLSGRPEALRVRAEGECLTFEVLATASTGTNTPIPMYLSVGCLDCPEQAMARKKLLNDVAETASKLVTTQGNSAQQLVTNVLIGGDCFDVKNIKSSGDSRSRGTFSQGQSSIDISHGIVLCTAPTDILPGPNNHPNANNGFGNDSPNDPDIARLTTGNQYDVSIIEFDFKPTTDKVQFDFVFGSEEYCEYVNSQYNDAFGFFISGPGINGVLNLAVIPGTTTPVTVNNVNYLKNQAYYRNNNKSGVCAPLTAVNMNDIELDGFTTVLTATANLIPCSTYRIKLAIADINDANFASAVFLRANSFNAGGRVLAEAIYPSPANTSTQEGCGNSYIRFYRGTGDASQPLTVNYTILGSSTAQAGVDFEPLPGSVVIPAGQTEVLVPVKVIADQITEGSEWFKLRIENSCSCEQQEVTFVIEDRLPVSVSMLDQLGCTGSATLTPVVSGGLPPYTYSWSNGTTGATLTQTTIGSSVYTVTVSDVCAQTAVATATLKVDVAPTATISGTAQFCAGGQGQLTINLTGNGPWQVGINAAGTPLTQTFNSSPATFMVSQGGAYTLTSVVSQAGCPGSVSGAATAQVISVAVSLTTTQPKCFGGRGSIQPKVTTNAASVTYSWSNGSTLPILVNQLAGVYALTVTTPQGCTATAVAALVDPPQLVATIQEVVNLNCYTPVGSARVNAQGGTAPYQYEWSTGSKDLSISFTKSGTYVVTVFDANGCTAVASTAVSKDTVPPIAVVQVNGELTCSVREVSLNSNGSSVGPNFTYAWSTTDGRILSAIDGSAIRVSAPGNYVLLITNKANGCTATAQAQVRENTNYPRLLDLQIDQPTCKNGVGSVRVLGVTGGVGPYVFSINEGRDFFPKQTFDNLQPGSYKIIVQDANGCEYETSFLLNPPIYPKISTRPELNLAYGESGQIALEINIPLAEIDHITWTPATGITPTDRPDVFLARPFQSGYYKVTLVNKDGCEAHARLLIRVGDPDIYAPNVFKAGGADGQNSAFLIFAREGAVQVIRRLEVFDRWGNLVFSRENIQPNDYRAGAWDGTFRGNRLNPGVFVWWAEIELASGEHIQMRGDVTLID